MKYTKRIRTSILFLFFLALICGAGLFREQIALVVFKVNPTLATLVGHGYASVYMAAGNYYFGGGAYDLESAEYVFRKVASINDEFVPLAHYQLARIYFIRGDFLKALYEIDQELNKNPEYMRSYYVRGLIYGFMGEYEKAAVDFEQFIAWKQEGWAAYNDLAWVYFMQGKFEKVQEVVERGLVYHPTNPWLNNTLGVALLNLGLKKEALEKLLIAQKGISTLTAEDWGKAYPGNDPRSYTQGYDSMEEQIEKNIALAREVD